MTFYLLLKASQIMHPQTHMIMYSLHGASNSIMINGNNVNLYQLSDMYTIDIFWSTACVEMNHTHTHDSSKKILSNTSSLIF